MSLFEYSTYRSYLKSYLKSLPRKGRGELTRIATRLHVNTSLLSQILGGTREFTSEQSYELSKYLGHTELELEYFQLLVQIDRAATHNLKTHLQEKLLRMRNEALKIANRVKTEKRIAEEDRAVFYSVWIYSAVHLFTSLKPEGTTAEEIGERFHLSREKTKEIMKFLVGTGLCLEEGMRFKMGVQSTFVEKGSPHLNKHHSNWRIKALNDCETMSDSDFMFTGQMSISKSDFLVLREKLSEYLKTAAERAENSKAEEIACLNLDFFILK